MQFSKYYCTSPTNKFHIRSIYFVAQSTNGGDEEDRTPDPLRARQVLSQLSYTPMYFLFVNIFNESFYYIFQKNKNSQN